MRSSTCILIAACAFVAASAETGAATDRMVGLVPSDGTNMLVKAFDIGTETTIWGARFENNDPATIFPEVLLVRGPAGAISEGTVVASASNVQETSLGVVEITWTTAIPVEPGTYYLAICPPAGAGKQGPGVGPALGANDVAVPNGSYLTCGAERSLLPVRADLAMSLLSAAGGGPSKAGVPPSEAPSQTAFKTFLRATRFGDGAVLRFGLKQAERVRLGSMMSPAGSCANSSTGRSNRGPSSGPGTAVAREECESLRGSTSCDSRLVGRRSRRSSS